MQKREAEHWREWTIQLQWKAHSGQLSVMWLNPLEPETTLPTVCTGRLWVISGSSSFRWAVHSLGQWRLLLDSLQDASVVRGITGSLPWLSYHLGDKWTRQLLVSTKWLTLHQLSMLALSWHNGERVVKTARCLSGAPIELMMMDRSYRRCE